VKVQFAGAALTAVTIACGRAHDSGNPEHTVITDSVAMPVSGAKSGVLPGPEAGEREVPATRQSGIVAPPVVPVVQSADAADLKLLTGELIIPVSGVIAGELRDTFTEARGEGRRHDAIDIPAPRGTPVLSASRGRVLRLFTSKAGGLMVYAADSSERFILMYAHLDSYAPGLADGASVTRGQTVGFVGTTGNAPPNVPHLHFAIARSDNVAKWWQGSPVNPYPLLKTR